MFDSVFGHQDEVYLISIDIEERTGYMHGMEHG